VGEPLALAVERALAARGATPEDAVRSENQRQATDQVSTGNTVTSLRFCSTLDWSCFATSSATSIGIAKDTPM